jgi:mannose-6-phosphate isomerase
LKWYADRIGRPLCEEAYRLDAFVRAYGRPGGSALLCDELSIDGSVRKSSTRSWPQTEAIKAAIALAEARGEPVGADVDGQVKALFATFLGRPVEGGWIDWVDADGAPLVHAIPASTFYHIFLGLAEYLRARAV